MDMKKFCNVLPKIELHAHLNGSLTRTTLKNLGCQENIADSYQINHELHEPGKALSDCFKLFSIAHKLTNTAESVYYATETVIEDFCNDNVIYLELRTTPKSVNGMTKEEYIESVVRAIKSNKRAITVKLLLSINRSQSLQESEESLQVFVEMKGKYPDIIKGIDLSGDPKVGSFDENLFLKARNNCFQITLHCGEVQNNEEIERMLKFHPDRLGHCTFLHPSYGGTQANWDLYCKLKIPTECCLTSNILCETSKSYKEHHVQEWLKTKLPFSLGTDDKGVFSTDLSTEYFLAHQNFSLTKEDLWNISFNSIDYSFATEKEKDRLKLLLLDWRENRI